MRSMPDTPSITINKVMPYRGKQEVWSNKYHFSGTTPTSQSNWEALATAIFNLEKTFLQGSVRYAGFLGYEAGNDHAIAQRDYYAEGGTLVTGSTGTASGADMPPGDAAVWVRWRTPGKTSKGKTIYLRKYFHGVRHNADSLQLDDRYALEAYGAAMIAGSLPGGVKVCGPQGAVASVPVVSPFITTHTLKRRGRRP